MPPIGHAPSVPEYTHEPTSDPRIFRFCDRYGDWTHYLYKEKPEERGKYFVAVNHVIKYGFPKDEHFMQYLLGTDKQTSEEKLKIAGNRGDRVHKAIADLVNGETLSLYKTYPDELSGAPKTLTPDEWDRLRAFERFAKRYRLELILHEEPIVSFDYSFAGTPDFLGTIVVPDDERTHALKDLKGQTIHILLDWKTSAAIYDEYKLQTAAYLEGVTSYKKEQIPLRKQYWTGVVRLGARTKDGYEFQAWTPEQTDKHFDMFYHAKETYHFVKGGEYDPTIELIPTFLTVPVPRVRIRKRTKAAETQLEATA